MTSRGSTPKPRPKPGATPLAAPPAGGRRTTGVGRSSRPRSTTTGALFEDDGPRIAAVEADPQDPNLRRVRVGRRVVAVLAAHDAEVLGVRPGASWDDALSASVERCARLAAARRDALRALAGSSIPSARLRARLARRGHAEALVEEVVAGLIRDGWLDDAQVADAAAESIQRRGRLPRGAVADRLVARGVDPELATRAARRGAAPGEEERAACAALAATLLARASTGRGASTRSGTPAGRRIGQRVAAALTRRGFDPDIIARVLAEAGYAGLDDPLDHP